MGQTYLEDLSQKSPSLNVKQNLRILCGHHAAQSLGNEEERDCTEAACC